MTNDEKIAAALKSDYLSELSVFEALPDCKISHSFERRMQKLIQSYFKEKNKDSIMNRRRIKIRLLIAAIIAATVALGTGSAVLLQYWDTFKLKNVGNDEYRFLVDDPNSAPLQLTEKYTITTDLSEYKKEIINDSEFYYWAVYTCEEDKTIWFSQVTKNYANSTQIGFGNVQVFPEKTPLGKYTAMYYVSADGTQNLIWDNGDYIFELSADGLSKEETKALALTVRNEK